MVHEILRSYTARHEAFLKKIMQAASIPAESLKDASNYVLFTPGKRIRPLLVYLCGELLEVDTPSLDIIAAAIELTHAYSLVHDDLPAMDNDDFRRGQPSCHRQFDEATAILVGDGLQGLAIELLITHLPKTLTPLQVLAVIHALVRASGFSGMISGQSMDLQELSNTFITEERLYRIHELKTGQLILACIQCVLCATTPSKALSTALENYAKHLGLAFQLQDDYLDAYLAPECLGKKRSSDQANHKTTFANLYSQTALLDRITFHYHSAKEALLPFENKAESLLALTTHLQQRDK